MKKLLIVLTSLIFGLNSVWASTILSECNSSNGKLSCPQHQTLQNQIDTAFSRFLKKFSANTLISNLQDLQTKIDFAKLELIANQKYSNDIRFLLEYLEYKIDVYLGNTTSIDNNSSNIDGMNISISRSDTMSGTVNLTMGTYSNTLLKIKIYNNSDKDMVLDGMTIDTNSAAFSTNDMKLYFDNNLFVVSKKYSSDINFTSIGSIIKANSWKEYVLQGDLASNFIGNISVGIKNFVIKDSFGNTITNMNTNIPYQNFNVSNGSNSSSSNTSTDTNGTVYANYQNPASNVIAGSDNMIDVGSFKFRIKFMKGEIQNMTLVNIGNNSASEVNQGNALSLSTNQADSVVSKIYLYSADGRELANSIMVNGIVGFNLQNANIPIDQDYLVIVKVKLNKIYNTQYDNKPLKLAMLKMGDCVNGYCSKMIYKDTGEQIPPIGIANFESKILNTQYLRKSVIRFSSLAQSSTSLAGTINLWGFNATPIGDNATIKEFKFNAYVYDSIPSGLQLNGNSFTLYINGQRISNSDVSIYNALGSCNGLSGNAINLQSNISGTANTTKQYCIKVVLGGAYANGYSLNQNSSYQFKINADVLGSTESDSITTNMSQFGGNMDSYSYDTLANSKSSVIWSDNVVDGLTTSSLNRFNDGLMGIDILNSRNSRM